MKYTFTNEQGKEQTVNIPDDYIATQKRTLGLSNKEAILLYLSDEGYISNPIVEELTNKAKNAGNQTRGKRKSPARKQDPIKRSIIASLFDNINSGAISAGDESLIETPRIINPERIISFTVGDDTFELTLSKKRKTK